MLVQSQKRQLDELGYLVLPAFVPSPLLAEIRERVASMAHFYGMLAGVKHGEPFFQKEVGLVDDLRLIPVQSI